MSRRVSNWCWRASTRTRDAEISARANKQTFLNSLFGAMFFPVCDKKFPVSIAGNSFKEATFLKGFVQAGRDVSTEIPCIFPRDQGISPRRRVRCSLPAQPQ